MESVTLGEQLAEAVLQFLYLMELDSEFALPIVHLTETVKVHTPPFETDSVRVIVVGPSFAVLAELAVSLVMMP